MKKWKQLTKTILASVMAFAMVTGYGMSVSATDHQAGTTATLTKTYKVPDGLIQPMQTFTFEFDAVSVDDVPATPANMPAISPASITFGLNEVLGGTLSGGFYTLDKPVPTDLSTLTWPHAGVYVYTVTEQATGVTEITDSLAKYTMTVYVENILASDVPTGNVHVTSVGFVQELNDAGTAGTLLKHSPVFVNVYNKVVPLTISKTVRGNFADTTKEFDYVLTLTRPGGEFAASAATYTGTLSGGGSVTVNFAAGSQTTTPITFELKHGESISFAGLPAGTVWELTEAGTAGYTPTVAIVNNGVAATDGASESDPLTITDDGTDPLVLGDVGANSAIFTNTYQTINPTGILLNNLPYILLIVVALGGFTGYIVSKRRKQYAR